MPQGDIVLEHCNSQCGVSIGQANHNQIAIIDVDETCQHERLVADGAEELCWGAILA